MKLDETEWRKVVANAVSKGWARYPKNQGPSLIDSLPDDEDSAPTPVDDAPIPPTAPPLE